MGGKKLPAAFMHITMVKRESLSADVIAFTYRWPFSETTSGQLNCTLDNPDSSTLDIS